MAVTTTNLDFLVIDTHDPKVIAIGDASVYSQGFIIVNPTIQIIPPSFSSSSHVFSTGNLNLYNSNTLNISCVEGYADLGILPDGIWKATFSVAPSHVYFVEKSWMRVAKLLSKYHKALLTTDLIECNQSIKATDKKTLDEIYSFIQGSISAANECNYTLSIELYNMANKMLINFNRSKSC